MCWDLRVDRGAWSERLRRKSAVDNLCQAKRTLANGIWRLFSLWLMSREAPEMPHPVTQNDGGTRLRRFDLAMKVSGCRPSRRSIARSPLQTRDSMASNGSYS